MDPTIVINQISSKPRGGHVDVHWYERTGGGDRDGFTFDTIYVGDAKSEDEICDIVRDRLTQMFSLDVEFDC
jgi:uncharacterized protein YodC (DUF2158 family)